MGYKIMDAKGYRDWAYEQIRQVDRLRKQVEKDGLCPVCHQKPSRWDNGNGPITCGDFGCIAEWINPGSTRRVKRKKAAKARQETHQRLQPDSRPAPSREIPPEVVPIREYEMAWLNVLRAFTQLPWREARVMVMDHYRRFNTAIPQTDQALKVQLHRARLKAIGLDGDEREMSKEWLVKGGYM